MATRHKSVKTRLFILLMCDVLYFKSRVGGGGDTKQEKQQHEVTSHSHQVKASTITLDKLLRATLTARDLSPF